ncbi:HEAT repeat domain-containing protein [Geobacter sp.]|uniref:HEAT repeat domain-containing protein n=1 Tax=Geobacter sp. TaxID=46610 RepID=UPI002632D3F9|nr:HEAT repeat domain-containing protein [Geobacter sp.]
MDQLHSLNERLHAPDEEERRRAVISLASRPLADVRHLLFDAMGDLSWRVRKEAVNIVLGADPDESAVEGLVGLLASPDNAGLRNSAVEALERLGSRAVPALLRRINDQDRDVRKFVIDILGNIADRSCIPSLVGALRDQDANVSAAAAENLGKIGDPRAVPHLVDALAVNDVWFRYSLLGALARIGEAVSFAVLAPLAADALLKRPVFECLGAVGDAEAVPLLVEGLAEKVRTTREAAATALVRLRGRLPAPVATSEVDMRLAALRGSACVDGLLVSLDTPDHGVYEALVRILGTIGDERAAVALLQGCRDERLRRLCLQGFRVMDERGMAALMEFYPVADDEERAYIMHVWGETGFAGCAPHLSEGMHSGRPMLRRVSALAAGKIGLVALLENVAALLDDHDPEVREGAVSALAQLATVGGERVRGIAQTLASAEASETRRSATRLYAALADTERLALLVKDEDPLVRRSAVCALAGLHDPECLGSLVMALMDEDPDVRIAAVAGIGGLGGNEAPEPLLLALRDDDPWVQSAALKALGRYGGSKVLDAIEGLLPEVGGVVLITALETLAAMEGERAAVLVKQCLDNPDEEVVKSAIDILAKGDAGWIEEYLERLLAHPHWEVRATFVRAMVQLLGAGALPHLERALESESDELVRVQLRDLIGRLV